MAATDVQERADALLARIRSVCDRIAKLRDRCEMIVTPDRAELCDADEHADPRWRNASAHVRFAWEALAEEVARDPSLHAPRGLRHLFLRITDGRVTGGAYAEPWSVCDLDLAGFRPILIAAFRHRSDRPLPLPRRLPAARVHLRGMSAG